jgi:hypothetical protein
MKSLLRRLQHKPKRNTMHIRPLVCTLAVVLILSAGGARANALNQGDIEAFRGLIAKNLDLKKDILTAGRVMAGDDSRQCMLGLATEVGGVADRLVLLITLVFLARDMVNSTDEALTLDHFRFHAQSFLNELPTDVTSVNRIAGSCSREDISAKAQEVVNLNRATSSLLQSIMVRLGS